MPSSKPDCRWWESTAGGEAAFFAECRDTGMGEPLKGVHADVALALNSDLDAAYCPWCGGCIVWCDENEVPGERAAEDEYRHGVRYGLYGY